MSTITGSSAASSTSLKSGCRWKDAPEAYGPHKTLYNRFVRWAAKGVWIDVFHALAGAGGPPAGILIDSSAVKAHCCVAGCKGGAGAGDRPLAGRAYDQDPRPNRRPRQTGRLLPEQRAGADCRAAEKLLQKMPDCRVVHADKAYDTDAIRHTIETRDAVPNIPPKSTRRWKSCYSPLLYRDRNAVERMFGRRKDFRRIATRYDRLAVNFMSAACLSAAVCHWL